MTPKEKAKELVEKYLPLVDCGDNIYTTRAQKENAKQCALIVVDELIKATEDVWFLDSNYWQEVKQEIEKI